jgi:hypothetical protein
MAERQLQFTKTSKNIHSAFYDVDAQALRVVFHSKHSGILPGVDENLAGDFERSDSPGSFYDTYFKKTGWTYNKLT